MRIEVTRFRKRDGYVTRHWAVMVDGELLAVTLYRKGAEAVAAALTAARAEATATLCRLDSSTDRHPELLNTECRHSQSA